jgi:hypothetical protein
MSDNKTQSRYHHQYTRTTSTWGSSCTGAKVGVSEMILSECGFDTLLHHVFRGSVNAIADG